MSFDSLADAPTWLLAIGGLLGLGVIFGHAWLSRRNPVWLGAIVPTVFVGANIVFAITDRPRVGELVGTGLTFIAMLIIWWAGEDTRARRRGEPVDD